MTFKKVCKQSLLLIWYILRLPSYKFHKFPLKDKFSGTAHVLVNGPSLKRTLEEYDRGKAAIDDNSFFVNLAALDSHFLLIRPKHCQIPCFIKTMSQRKKLLGGCMIY